MFSGIDNKALPYKDRLSLLSITQVMYINGKSQGEIKRFADEFSGPRVKEFPKIGREFSQLMGTAGFLSTLIILSLHWAGL